MQDWLAGALAGVTLSAFALWSSRLLAPAPHSLPSQDLKEVLSLLRHTVEALSARPPAEEILLQALREAQDRALVMLNPPLLRELYAQTMPKPGDVSPRTSMESWREALKTARLASLRRQAAEELGETFESNRTSGSGLVVDPDLVDLEEFSPEPLEDAPDTEPGQVARPAPRPSRAPIAAPRFPTSRAPRKPPVEPASLDEALAGATEVAPPPVS